MRITDMNSGQNLSIGNISDILSKLNVGDVLRAQIIESAANELFLKLFDGTTVKASAMVPIDVKKGEFLDFRVKNKTDSQIFIETLKNIETEIGAQNDLKSRLSAIDIKSDQNNIEIAKALESYDLPVNKEIFTKVINCIEAFKDLSPLKAAFLASNNMGINQGNIDVLSGIVDGRIRIGQNLSDLLNSLDGINDSELYKRLEKSSTGISTSTGGRDIRDNGTQSVQLTSVVSKNISEASLNIYNTDSKLYNSNAGESFIKLLQDITGKNVMSFDRINLRDIEKLVEKGVADNILDAATTKRIMDYIKSKSDCPEGLFKDREELAGFLKNTGLNMNSDEEKYSGVTGTDKGMAEPGEDKELTHLKKAIEDMFVRLDSKSPDKDLNMKSVYRDIYEKLEAIKESLAGLNSADGEKLSNKIDNIQSSIRFMNEINSHSTYIQIPINLMDKKTSAELYILKRDSKRKKIDPENVTMYISLDTQNIGRVDSLISLNKRNLSLNVRVADKRVQNFIKDSHNELYRRLDDIGYKLVDLKCRVKSDDVNLLNVDDVIKKEIASKVSIDYKI
jgi:hypothetical protein